MAKSSSPHRDGFIYDFDMTAFLSDMAAWQHSNDHKSIPPSLPFPENRDIITEPH